MNPENPYTVTDDKFICDNFKKLSSPKIAKILNRSDASIRNRKSILGLVTRQKRPPWTADEDKIIKELYTKHLSIEDIAKTVGRSICSVRLRANKKHNIWRSDAHISSEFRGDNFYVCLKGAISRGTAKTECCLCGYNKYVDLHHVDGNHQNNDIGNISSLCPNHHREVKHGEHATKSIYCIWWRIYSDGTCSEKCNNQHARKNN